MRTAREYRELAERLRGLAAQAAAAPLAAALVEAADEFAGLAREIEQVVTAAPAAVGPPPEHAREVAEAETAARR